MATLQAKAPTTAPLSLVAKESPAEPSAESRSGGHKPPTKGLKTLFIILLLCTVALVAVILSPLYFEEDHSPAKEAEESTIPEELNVNRDTVSHHCSHYDKEWHICMDPAWGGTLYCPAYAEFNQTDLERVAPESDAVDVRAVWDTCFTCPEAGSNCSTVVADIRATNDLSNYTYNMNYYNGGMEYYCEKMCESKQEGETCTDDSGCTQGRSFCDFESNDVGTCKLCPTDPKMCFQDGFTSSEKGKLNCRYCSTYCFGARASNLWVNGESMSSRPIDGAIQASHQNASGALHDCSSVWNSGAAKTCSGAKGKICLTSIANDTDHYIFWVISDQAELSGCVGVVVFGYIPYPFWHDDTELLIPLVSVDKEEGLKLQSENIGADAKMEVDTFGATCFLDSFWPIYYCNIKDPCHQGEFCAFWRLPIAENEYREGDCQPCPKDSNGDPDPLACYFDVTALDGVRHDYFGALIDQTFPDTTQNVMSCARACGAEAALNDKECKYCSEEITEFQFAQNDEDRCVFCPQDDILYPDRIVPLFGDTVTCSDMDTFFQRLPVPQSSSNCQLAQSMNYICGCEGKGYGGANTQSKKAALAWMPRISACLSFLVSLIANCLIRNIYSWSHILISFWCC